MTDCVIRTVEPDRDADACALIYGHFVRESVATFEYEPPSVDEMSRRIVGALINHEWLVAENDGGISGFAYASTWNSRPAYDWTCETTIYLRPGEEGRGIGAALYGALTDVLRSRGFHLAIGRIALPNEASVRLHDRLGYKPVGVHRALGFKHNRWVDVMHTALQLRPADTAPSPVLPR